MAQNREQLEALLKFIDKLCKEGSNEWFIEQLRSRYAGVGFISTDTQSSIVNQKVDYIYEYCIERIVRKQADEFYQNFPIKGIVPILKEDYVRMELFHRKDNFGDFCLALYQQIENITNKMCERKDLNEIAQAMWPYPAYVMTNKYNDLTKRWDKVEPRIENRMTGEYSIAKLLFPGNDRQNKCPNYMSKTKYALQSQFAMDKIRNVVYFMGFKGMMKSGDYDQFISYTTLLSDIYNCRNMNHRGNTLTEWEKSVQDKVLSMKSFYYFKFIGALAQYVEYIREGLPLIGNLKSYSQSLAKNKVGLNVLGKIDVAQFSKFKKK